MALLAGCYSPSFKDCVLRHGCGRLPRRPDLRDRDVPGAIGLNGGRGADVADANGAAGTSGPTHLDSGAGGGGGLGRIRLRALTRGVAGNVIPSPTP